MTRSTILWAVAGLIALAPRPGIAREESRSDTASYQIEEIVVRALKGEDRLHEIPAATFVFSRGQIRRSGVTRLSSLIGTLPGLYGYLQGGTGDFGVVDPRGFTANGESSYLRLLVNGQDARDLENGRLDWDWFLPEEVERLEVVEGPGAWLYGDGAEGGIVNIVRPEAEDGLRARAAARYGNFGLRTGSLSLSAGRPGQSGSARGSFRRVQGWRDRSRERVYGGGVEARQDLSGRTRLTFDAAWLRSHREDPGALTPEQLSADRRQADTRTDFMLVRRLLLGARLVHGRAADTEWSLAPYFRTEDNDRVRTFFTNTLFAQTQSHPTESWTMGAEVGWRRSLRIGRWPVALSAGSQVEHAALGSRYYDFEAGSRGALRSDVDAWRSLLSAFASGRVTIAEGVTGRLGFRQDAIRVRAENRLEGTEVPARTRSAATPFVSLAHRLGRDGSAYVTYSSAFRVPTLNQLFDRGPFDDPFGGGTSYLSNPDLEPQRAHSLEVGGRIDGSRGTFATLTLYGVRVRDEIDFDAATLSYSNIGRSWHRGVEFAVHRPLGPFLAGRISATYSPTTIRGGEHDGNQINAVPLGTAFGSLAWTGAEAWSVEAALRYVGRQYLDKANQHRLGDFASVEAGGSVLLGRVRASLRVANLLDREYADTGFFVDLGSFSQERFHPAAGRSFTLSLSVD